MIAGMVTSLFRTLETPKTRCDAFRNQQVTCGGDHAEKVTVEPSVETPMFVVSSPPRHKAIVTRALRKLRTGTKRPLVSTTETC
jgi:hypothetical protein